MLLQNRVNALFADKKALRGREDLALDEEVRLPALHPLFIRYKFGELRPHALDMLKLVLEFSNHFLLLILLIARNVLKILAPIIVVHLFGARL